MNILDQEIKAKREFCINEIRRDYNRGKFFINWLNNDLSQQISGDAFFLEKRDDIIFIGNLFEENFKETKVSELDLIDFINNHLYSKD